MSEGFSQSTKSIVSAEYSEVQGSGGSMLRKAREAAGLQMAALAVLLKVPVKKLEALETDRFDLLPDTVFVRALAASVCRTLKIDATPILERLPHSETPALKSDESGINTPFRPSGTGSTLAFWDNLSKPLAFVVLGLLIGAAILIFAPKQLPFSFVEVQNTDSTNSNAPILSQASNIPLATSPVSIEPASPIQVSGTEQANSEPVVSASPSSSVAVTLPVDTDVVAGTVVFKARDTSWVEVVDANSVVQARRTMSQGEVATVSGALPLAVVVGRASNMDVLVRGQPFDLVRLAKDNVARFEVK